MKDLADAIKFIAYIVTRVNTMKRTRFWGLLLSPIIGIAVYRLPEIIAALSQVWACS